MSSAKRRRLISTAMDEAPVLEEEASVTAVVAVSSAMSVVSTMSALTPVSVQTSPPASAAFLFGHPTVDIQTRYTIGRPLGQPGCFGKTHLVTELATGVEYAVKVVEKKRMDPATRGLMINEISILEKVAALRHPNLIAFKEFFEDEHALYLVMECAHGGELLDRLKAGTKYSELDASRVMAQLIEAVSALHTLDIVHADLKPENLMFADSTDGAVLKMIDFGQASRLRPGQLLHVNSGTPYYRAPEQISYHYNKSCDLWACGIILYVLLYGYPPFFYEDPKHENNPKLYRAILDGFRPVSRPGYGPWFNSDIDISSSAKDLIAKLLTSDVTVRLTAHEALQHPWLAGRDVNGAALHSSVLTALAGFVSTNKFKNAVCALMAHELTLDSTRAFHAQFRAMDTNHDGTLRRQFRDGWSLRAASCVLRGWLACVRGRSRGFERVPLGHFEHAPISPTQRDYVAH